MERFSFIFLVAGLCFFALAFCVSAVLPMLPVKDIHVQTMAQLSARPPLEFEELKEEYPAAFRKAFYHKTDEQTLTDLQTRYPKLFKDVFAKSDADALAMLKRIAPETFKQVFPDMDAEDALDDLADNRDERLAAIKKADPKAFAATFELSVAGALATLHADYGLTLTRIQRADPAAYHAVFDERPDSEVFAEALSIGRQTYIGEGCWHCHSQQVRPWGNDEARYGQVSFPEEYQNEMNYPPLWGTRRIGPDLIRRGGYHSNDWHVAHFINPRNTSPYSVMPGFPWFYEADELTPNKTGLSVIAYIQWLGSWQTSVKENVYNMNEIDRLYPPAEAK